jgi:hypothetical protein
LPNPGGRIAERTDLPVRNEPCVMVWELETIANLGSPQLHFSPINARDVGAIS